MHQMAGLLRTTWSSGTTGTSRTASRQPTCCWTGAPGALWWRTQWRTRAASSTQRCPTGSTCSRRAGSSTRGVLAPGTIAQRKFVLFWRNSTVNLDRSPRPERPRGRRLKAWLFPQPSWLLPLDLCPQLNY